MNQSDKQNSAFETQSLLKSTAALLQDFLVNPSKHDGKMRFKKLVESDQQFVAEMPTLQGETTKINLILDQSEYIGTLKYSVFKQFVSQLVSSIIQALEKDTVTLRKEKNGQRYLLNSPAALEFDGQLNVMMLGLNLLDRNEITLELQFFEPSQFLDS